MKKPDVCLEEKIKKRIAKKFRFLSKKSLQLEYLFIISEIFWSLFINFIS
jgi:hypothetical protein